MAEKKRTAKKFVPDREKFEPLKFKPPQTTREILTERGVEYGSFLTHAHITQDLKIVMQNTNNWRTLSMDKKEALEMIANKIGRILNGNASNVDSWQDIAGYAQLVVDELNF